MTVAERQVLTAKEATGVRLSCQIVCDRDMTVRAMSRLTGSDAPSGTDACGRDCSATGVDDEVAALR